MKKCYLVFILLLLFTFNVQADDDLAIDGRSAAGHIIYDEGTKLKQRIKLNFVGAGSTCSDNAATGMTTCTITGGEGTGGSIYFTNDGAGSFSASTVDFLTGLTVFQSPDQEANIQLTLKDVIGGHITSDTAYSIGVQKTIIADQTLATPTTGDYVLFLDATDGALKKGDTDDVIETSGGAGGSGDVTAVGPGCATGDCFKDGTVTSGTSFAVWEGTTDDDNEYTLIIPEDPEADINVTLPTATGTITTTADKLSVFAATTSAELSAVLSDEDGTGACGANVYCIGGHSHELNNILDPTSATALSFDDNEGITLTTAEDTGIFFSIENTDPDLAHPTYLMDLRYQDDGSGYGIYIQCLDDSEGTPNPVFTVGANGDVNTDGSVTATGGFSGDLTGDVTGNVSGSSGSTTGNAATASALAANGANCDAGNYPLGVDASGAVESCTAAPTAASLSVDDLITLSGVAGGETHLSTFTGTTITDNQTIKAGMQLLETEVETKAPTASPTLTGTPAAPTAAGDTNTTQIATTAFVQQEINGAGGRSLTCSSGSCDADSELYTGSISFYIYNHGNSSEVWGYPPEGSPPLKRPFALTVTRVDCQTDKGTTTMNLLNGDNYTEVLSADLVCDTDGQSSCASGCNVNTINTDNDNFAAFAPAGVAAYALSEGNTTRFDVIYTIDD